MIHVKDLHQHRRRPAAAASPVALRHRRDRLPADLRGGQARRQVVPLRAGRRPLNRRSTRSPTARSIVDAVRGAAAPALYASSPTFGAGRPPDGHAAPGPITVKNTGDAPLTITAPSRSADRRQRPTDEAPRRLLDRQQHLHAGTAPRHRRRPPSTLHRERAASSRPPHRRRRPPAAHLERGRGDSRSTWSARAARRSSLGGVGGDVDSMLSLTLGGPRSFGSFVPAVARTTTRR